MPLLDRSTALLGIIFLAGAGCGGTMGIPVFGYKTSPGPLSEWDARLVANAHLEIKTEPPDEPGSKPILYLDAVPGGGHVLRLFDVWNSNAFATEPMDEELILDLPARLEEGARITIFANSDLKGSYSASTLGWGEQSNHVAGYVTVVDVSSCCVLLELDLAATRFQRAPSKVLDLRGLVCLKLVPLDKLYSR
jgi:hypothetical protein